MDKSKKKILYNIILVILVGVFLYSSYKIVDRLIHYKKDDNTYASVKDDVINDENINETNYEEYDTENEEIINNENNIEIEDENQNENNTEQTEDKNEINKNVVMIDGKAVLKEYSKLYEQNNDLAGWISVPGFDKSIDYPIMHAKDNDYYLNRDFYENYSYAGAIYFDYKNNPDRIEDHFVIYGHAMSNKAMLGNFKDYPENKKKQEEIKYIYIDLLHTKLKYEIFSTHYAKSDYDYRRIYFPDDEYKLEYFNNLKELSTYDFGVELSQDDKFITLSTCNSSISDSARSVTHAKLVGVVSYDEEIERIKDENALISSNIYLEKLSVIYPDENNEQNFLTLDPPFNPIAIKYWAYLPEDTPYIDLEYKLADPESKITILKDGDIVNSNRIKLDRYKSTVEIIVDSRDDSFQRIYTFFVYRYIPEIEENETKEENETDIEEGNEDINETESQVENEPIIEDEETNEPESVPEDTPSVDEDVIEPEENEVE